MLHFVVLYLIRFATLALRRVRDSNPRYVSVCLVSSEMLSSTQPTLLVPIRVSQHKDRLLILLIFPSYGFAGEEGFEPPTNGFGDHCATTALLTDVCADYLSQTICTFNLKSNTMLKNVVYVVFLFLIHFLIEVVFYRLQ